jgi:protease PrsW
MNHVIADVSVLIYFVGIYLLMRSTSGVKPLQLIFCVFLGVLSAAAAIGLEYLWNYFLADFIRSHPSLIFIESFIGVSLIEEFSKWILLVLVVSRARSFRFYTVGILYACGIAAGFNFVESNIYATIEEDPIHMIIRSFTAVPVHFLFAIVMGFLYSRYKLEGNGFLWYSLLIPVVLHGLYDFFILQPYADLLIGAALLVLIGCLALSVWICRIAVKADKLRMAIEKA